MAYTSGFPKPLLLDYKNLIRKAFASLSVP